MPSKRIMGDISEEDLNYFQGNLRIYIKSYRQSKKVKKEEILKELGCSSTTLTKYESTTVPAPPVTAIASLKPLADLRGMDLDMFVAAIIGKTNEEGEGNYLVKELANKIEKYNAKTQFQIFNLLKYDQDKISKFLDLVDRYMENNDENHSVFNCYLSFSDKIKQTVKNLIRIINGDKDAIN